jgi:hypothetical protein
MSLLVQNDADNNSFGSDSEMDFDYYQDTYEMESVASSTEFSTIIKKNKKNKKPEDSGYRKIKSKGGDLVYFTSSLIPGSSIRDAIYGQYDFTSKIGSSDEDLFFKLINKSNGIDRLKEDHLFYDNPEQCERHMGITISQGTKDKWREKYQNALNRLPQQEPPTKLTVIT